MARGEVRYRLTLDSKGFETGLKAAEAAFKAVVAGSFVVAAKRFVDAQSAQEDAINSLNLALANQGRYTAAVSKSLQDFAGQMQSTTKFTDDAVLQAGALLASFGLNEQQIKRTTKAAADFAQATGKDLRTSAELLGKAFAGNTASLSRYGIVISESIPKSERFGVALKQLEQRFGGAAVAGAATLSGQMAILQNALGDTEESLGKLIGAVVGSQKPFAGLIALVEKLNQYIGVGMVLALSEARAQFTEFVAFVVEAQGKVQSLVTQGMRGAIPAWLRGNQASPGSNAEQGYQDLAASLREQAQLLREQGNQAALSAGNLLEFKNAATAAAGAVEELNSKLKTYVFTMGPYVLPDNGRITRTPFDDVLQTIGGEHPSGRRIGSSLSGGGGLQMATAAGRSWEQQLERLAHTMQALGPLTSGFAGKLGGLFGGIAGIGAALKDFKGAGGGFSGFLGKLGAIGSIAAVGLSIFGGLFGGGARRREEERRQREQDQQRAMQEAQQLAERWERFRSETIDKGVTGLGDVFGYLATQTNVSQERLARLGVVGTAMFGALLKSGMSMVDAVKRMGPALEQAAAAGVNIGGGSLGNLSEFQALVQENEALVKAAEGLGAALNTLTVTGSLTQETFSAITGEAAAFFAELTEKGFTSNQALAVLAPTLYAIAQQAQGGRVAVDAETQALIDMADSAGLFENLRDPLKDMAELLKLQVQLTAALAVAYGVTLPQNIKKSLDALNQIPGIPGAPAAPVVPDAPFHGGGEGFAAGGIATGPTSGYFAKLHGTEAVVPLDKPSAIGRALGGDLSPLVARLDSIERLLRQQPSAIRAAVLLGRA